MYRLDTDGVMIILVGDFGEQGDKGPVGKAIDGPVGDQGEPGTTDIVSTLTTIISKQFVFLDQEEMLRC